MAKTHRIFTALLSLLMSSQMFSLPLMASKTSDDSSKSTLDLDSSRDESDQNSDQNSQDKEDSDQKEDSTDSDTMEDNQESSDKEDDQQNPDAEPQEQPGIDVPGETFTENEDGASYTVHSYTSQGVYSQSIVAKGSGKLISIDVELKEIPDNNSLKDPLAVDLGTNPVLDQAITLSGSAAEADQANPVTFAIPEADQNLAVSLPLTAGSVSAGSVAVNARTNSVFAQSIAEDNTLRLFVSDGLMVKILDKALSFADMNGAIPNYWKEAAAFMSSRGLMTGIHDGADFDPQGIVTRGQLAEILYRYEGSPKTEGALPEGVSSEDFFAEASKWAVSQGLMGVGSLFNGGKLLSREELTTILYRFARIPGPANLNVLNHFPDRIAVSQWAMDGMAWAIDNNIIGLGTSELDPQSDGIRVDLAVMIQRFITNVIG